MSHLSKSFFTVPAFPALKLNSPRFGNKIRYCDWCVEEAKWQMKHTGRQFHIEKVPHGKICLSS